MVSDERLAHIELRQLLQAFLGETLKVPVYLGVRRGHAEGEYLLLRQLPEGEPVDEGHVPGRRSGLEDYRPFFDMFHYVVSPFSPPPAFLRQLSSRKSSRGT